MDQINNLENEENNNDFVRLKLLRRQLRDNSNPFLMPEHFFKQYYRMSPNVAIDLIHLLEDKLVMQREKIPLHLIVLIMLRFFAHGSFQRSFSNDFNHPIGQSTASRYLHLFLQAILQLGPTFIHFPSTQQERQRISAGFQRTIRIPHILGLVDGFIVSMKRPSENEEAFFNYKHGPAVNVQIVANCNYLIRSLRIVPGSNNDQFNWNFSEVRQHMEMLRDNEAIVQEEGSYYILGDSGYASSRVLLTPILDAPEGSPASVYTEEHVGTRCKVEQTIGILSGVWKVIYKQI